MHERCQQCGAPVRRNPLNGRIEDAHTLSAHFCRLSWGMLFGNEHECICGARIIIYDDGCRLDCVTGKAHVCGLRGARKAGPASKTEAKHGVRGKRPRWNIASTQL